MHYLPLGADPLNVHWLQLIRTNAPLGNVATWQLPYDDPGFVFYIDNAGNPNPFYDAVYSANASDFLDSASRGYQDTSQWNGFLFLATGDDIAHTMNISQFDVFWGFHDPVVPVPEPGTFALVLAGCLIVRAAAMRRMGRLSKFRPVNGG